LEARTGWPNRLLRGWGQLGEGAGETGIEEPGHGIWHRSSGAAGLGRNMKAVLCTSVFSTPIRHCHFDPSNRVTV